MDKYAVLTQTDDNNIKLASESICPICGAKLEELNVKKCPVHGTKPFEAEKNG